MDRPPATYQVSGAALRKTRMRLGLLPRQVAEAAGLSRSYIQRLEDGTASGHMRPPSYAALRTALGIAPDDDQLLASPEEPEQER